MKRFLIELHAVPTAAAINAEALAGAFVNAFVIAASQQDAVTQTQAHLMSLGWIGGDPDEVSEPTDELILSWETRLIQLAAAAGRKGIAVELVAYPKVDRHPDSPATYQSLTPPLGGSTSVN